MSRVAIYEPDPRICGPDSWARHLRDGFRELGVECDVVTFTRSGKRKTSWGRVVRDRGQGQSCSLDPDKVFPVEMGGAALDDYDLVVLTDVKCPTQDKPAYKRGEAWPEYVDILAGTETPWTSALHGKWYFEEDELPDGVNVERGSPYLGDLLGLANFTGFLIEHAALGTYCQHSARLRATRRVYHPLPYKLQVSLENACIMMQRRVLCSLGRVTKVKYKHYISQCIIAGMLPNWQVIYAGGSSCQIGPNESYQLYEQCVRAGLSPHQREGGAKSAYPWVAGPVQYYGMYQQASEIALGCKVHVGITDYKFSGGLLEFSTLEAIDCGCIPVVAQDFVPPYGDEMCIESLPYDLHGHHGVISEDGKQIIDCSHDPYITMVCFDLAACIQNAALARREATIKQNRDVLQRYHDPKIHAREYLNQCL